MRTPRNHGKRPLVSIVCPTLSITSERFGRMAEALHEHTLAPYELIVIDAAGAPRGFTEPVNRGIRMAAGDYVVITNDDVCVTKGWWEPLQEALDDGVSIAFPTTRNGFDRTDLTGWFWSFKAENMDRWSYDEDHFLCPELTVWWSDTEMVDRLTADGSPPVKVAESLIEHELSQTLNDESDPLTHRWLWARIRSDEQVYQSNKRQKPLASTLQEPLS